MHEIIKRAQMSFEEEISTFNMGIGMAICCNDYQKLKIFLNSLGIEHMEIGEVIERRENDLDFTNLQ
jgi:phosphoribosylaminoimidazole (AIR) synthetase